jgi:HEAT repeat protein
MHRFLYCLLLLPLLGCRTPDRPPQDEPPSILWRDLGTRLPTLQEVKSLRAKPLGALSLIRRDLASPSTLTRRRAAYLLEQLGRAGRPAESALRGALEREKDPVNYAFIIRAFAALEAVEPESIKTLGKAFYRSDNPVLHTYAAGAIVSLTSVRGSTDELQILLDSLNPVEPAIEDLDEKQFWEARWAAAYMCRKLGDEASALLPALENLSEATNVPPWVRKQALFALRRAAIGG